MGPVSLFITFEGGEGSGKSYQSGALYRYLLKQNRTVILTREPGGTPLGQKLRRVLKDANGFTISPLAELMLFNASRAQLMTDVIEPALDEGKIVICDRYTDSTTVYQSYGRGLDQATVNSVNRAATGGRRPDLVILLDTPPETGLARKKNHDRDRFEREKLAFHQRVRAGYLTLAAVEPERWLVIDATRSRQAIAAEIRQRVSQLLKK
jgi:dTMP kinase